VLAGISTVQQIANNPIDIKATGRLNKLCVERTIAQPQKHKAGHEGRGRRPCPSHEPACHPAAPEQQVNGFQSAPLARLARFAAGLPGGWRAVSDAAMMARAPARQKPSAK